MKYFLTLLIGVVVFGYTTSMVAAQAGTNRVSPPPGLNIRNDVNSTVNSAQERSGSTSVTRENVTEKIAEVCDQAEVAVTEAIARYENNITSPAGKFRQIKEKLTRVIGALQKRNIDTTQLAEHLVEFEEQIDTLSTSSDSALAQLKTTQGLACGNSQGEYRAARQRAVQLHRQVRANTQVVKEYYQTVIREDIKELREQLGETKPSTGSATQGDL